MESLIPIAIIIFGVFIGALITWAILRSKAQRSFDDGKAAAATEIATLNERVAAKDRELADLRETIETADRLQQQTREEARREAEQRSAAEQAASRIPSLEQDLKTANLENSSLRATFSALEAKLESQETNAREKLELLFNAREELTVQFKALANDLLDEKSRTFDEQNKSALNTLLTPLANQLRDFEKKVEDVYDKESKQRFSLEIEIKNLRDLNTQISQEAINLTNALKGQSKTQGTWGEIILERVLEMSGLVKGREYEIQVTLTAEDGRRSCPDVIVFLPEKRHLVIDSKVNVVPYERYCTLSDGVQREAELTKYLTAFRRHIKELDVRSYQAHYKLNSLDFVLMFVPIEGAFVLAVQSAPDLFDEAFKKNLVLVSPSTLLATMRTISNLWRQENQNRNALKIAVQAGRLYDKFAAFVNDLEDIGSKLRSAQETCEDAQKKLISGRGNIVKTIDNLKLLGARTKKKLPQDLIDDATEEDEMGTPGLLPNFEQTPTNEDPEPLLNFTAASGEG